MADAVLSPSGLSAHVHELLTCCEQGHLPVGMAFTRLLMEAASPGDLARAIDTAHASLAAVGGGTDPKLRHVDGLRRLLLAHPAAWRTVRSVLDQVEHDLASTDDAETAVVRCAATFDRAAQDSPEASVALYSLGDKELLDAATADVVDRMREWGLLGHRRVLLEVGCGIGRFQRALAGEVGHISGLDIAPVMVEIARRRCAGLTNVSIRHSSGLDLLGVPDASVDCVFAVDTFPYIVQGGMTLAATHFHEAARVLKHNGDFLVLNFSYRGDPGADREDVERLAAAADYTPVRMAERPFRLWDGVAFHLRSARCGSSRGSAPELIASDAPAAG